MQKLSLVAVYNVCSCTPADAPEEPKEPVHPSNILVTKMWSPGAG